MLSLTKKEGCAAGIGAVLQWSAADSVCNTNQCSTQGSRERVHVQVGPYTQLMVT